MTSRNLKIFRSLSEQGRLEFMAGGRVTTEKMWQAAEDKRSLVSWWVAKIRGIIISTGNTWKFETEEEAKQFGKETLAMWKKELAAEAEQPQ